MFKISKQRCADHKARCENELLLISAGRMDAIADLLERFGIDVKKEKKGGIGHD